MEKVDQLSNFFCFHLLPLEFVSNFVIHNYSDTTLESLRFLTIEQALADAAHFVGYVSSEAVSPNAGPVIAIGGHYSASLAVWLRQKYPHLVAGACKYSFVLFEGLITNFAPSQNLFSNTSEIFFLNP